MQDQIVKDVYTLHWGVLNFLKVSEIQQQVVFLPLYGIRITGTFSIFLKNGFKGYPRGGYPKKVDF